MIGETVAHYRVTEKLGEGGMGVVYRATDTKLGREVALKVLPAVFAGDPQRMARFSREAQVLASLNHPHIASIYGLEETDGVRALAMELAEGEDLSDRIAKGRIPLEAALSIALQVAEALEDAHKKSIIHRDLKPANIKITPDGRVKVLDFGLAKALEKGRPQEEMANSPTLTMAATQAGVILGTAGYMSPEQARGSAADRRSDIWSFGVILFEMLSGRSAFGGKTMSDVLASVLKVDINWQNLPRGLPNQVLRVLHRTLQEDPSQRIHDIADVGIELREALSEPKYDVLSSDSTVSAKPGLRAVVPWALLGVAVVALFVLWLQPGGGPLPLLKLRMPVEPAKSFASDVSTGRSRLNFNNKPRVSPDGTRVAYTAAGMLWVRSLDELEPRLVSDLPQAGSPFWSPDSESLGFSIRDTVYRVARRDSAPTEICRLDGGIIGCVWGPNDRIVISKWRGGLYEVSARGGTPKLILDPQDGEVDFHDPLFLPGTDILLANIHAEKEAESYLAKISNGKSIRLEETTRLGDQVSHAVYDQSGHLLYTTADRRIWAVPFSKGSLTPTGEPFQVAVESTFPDVADNGTLLYLDLSSVEDRVFQLVWLSREGEVAGSIGEPMAGITLPRISPDGGHVVFSANTDTENAGTDLWVVQSDGQRPRRLTFDA
jgi:serine/threonine-protein kinase